MRILMITGSPRTNGTSNVLSAAFCQGAKEAGHEVIRFDAAKMDVHPCIACMQCVKEGGICTFDDDMTLIYPELDRSDVIVFVSPVYYYDVTAQLKTVIDRFYSVHGKLKQKRKKAIMISVCGDSSDWTMDAARIHFTGICRNLGWEETARLLALGYYEPHEITNSDWPQKAYLLGKNL